MKSLYKKQFLFTIEKSPQFTVLYLRDDVCKNRTCVTTIPASISDRAHISAMDSQSVYKTFLEDDRVDIICEHVR